MIKYMQLNSFVFAIADALRKDGNSNHHVVCYGRQTDEGAVDYGYKFGALFYVQPFFEERAKLLGELEMITRRSYEDELLLLQTFTQHCTDNLREQLTKEEIISLPMPLGQLPIPGYVRGEPHVCLQIGKG